MVGLVVAAHGRLAEELVTTAEGIVGPLSPVATVRIEPGSPLDRIREEVQRAVASVDSGDGVLVLADLFGGTPCRESLMLCGQRRIEVVAGVNLPIIIKASSLRSGPLSLPDMAHMLTSYGQKTITCASDLVRDMSAQRNH
jgi:PTS system mannose-specific IIA component